MAKTRILKEGWAKAPNAFFVAAMRTTDQRNAEVETANQQWIASRTAFHTAFMTLDEAYQRSLMSFTTKAVAEKDDERDVYGQVLEQVAKQWARLPDDGLAIHGRRVYQVFRDIDFRTSEALVAERSNSVRLLPQGRKNEKITNIEQRFGEAALQQDLQAMSLTSVNQRFATLTQEIIQLMNERNEESAARVQGELKAASQREQNEARFSSAERKRSRPQVKAAREAMDAVYADFVELTNALIVIGSAPELEQLAAVLNADYKKIEEQMAQSKKLPTVLVTSDIVGNHRYSVPELAKWADIISANEKSFAIDPSTDYIISLAPKAKKVGGLFLALNGAAVRPTDAVDAKKEYDLLVMDGSTPVTPVEPEVTPVVEE